MPCPKINLIDLINNPAFYSAIASMFSALAAWIMVSIHRTNAREAVRPIIILLDWARSETEDVINIRKVKNVGKGPALVIFAEVEFANPPLASMSTQRISILPPDNEISVDWNISLWFKNAKVIDPSKIVFTSINIFCFDTLGNRHETTYKLYISKGGVGIFGLENYAPLVQGYRTSRVVPSWWLRVVRHFPTLNRFLSYLKDKFRAFIKK